MIVRSVSRFVWKSLRRQSCAHQRCQPRLERKKALPYSYMSNYQIFRIRVYDRRLNEKDLLAVTTALLILLSGCGEKYESDYSLHDVMLHPVKAGIRLRLQVTVHSDSKRNRRKVLHLAFVNPQIKQSSALIRIFSLKASTERTDNFSCKSKSYTVTAFRRIAASVETLKDVRHILL